MYCGLKIIFLLISVISVYITGLLLQREINKYKLEAKDLEKKEKKILKTKLNNKKKYIFTAAVLLNLGILIALKYFNFFANTTVGFLKIFDISVTAPVIKVILPLGISYYTLQAISYIIDVKREKYEAEKNIFKLGLFITFFPQLCEGPFVDMTK